MKTDELEINCLHSVKIEEEIEYPDHVTVSKETIKGNTKHCITCKRCINSSVHDGITKKKIECKCASGDITTEENLVENVNSENNLTIQKGKKLVCDYCDERFKCKCYIKRNINFHGKKKK
ncbi:uncharacterized protein LOC142326636 [Lycorma delicatula]|uniref:uncharacterized protein LOC142326636 n=1 Tax=Lycorma delicatula TaxID=130591 RepID=UPI003F518B66